MGTVPFFKKNNIQVNKKETNNTNESNAKSNKQFSLAKRKKQIIHTTQIYCYDSDDSHYLSDESQSPVRYSIRKKPSTRSIYNINILSFNFSNILKYAGCFSLLKRNKLEQ